MTSGIVLPGNRDNSGSGENKKINGTTTYAVVPFKAQNS